MTFRNKVTDAMNSGKVMRFNQLVKTPVELDENGNQKLDEDIIDFLYRGGEFPRHARFEREDGELVELFDKKVSGSVVAKMARTKTLHFEDADDTPVGDRVDWEWIEENWQ